MANETIGELDHHCGYRADVRRNKNRRLYISCPYCGLLAYGKEGGQDFILENAVMYNEHGKLSEAHEKPRIRNVMEKQGKYETVILESNDEEPVTENKATENEKVVTDKRQSNDGIESMAL